MSACPTSAASSAPHFKANAQGGDVNRVKVPAVRLRLGKDGDERARRWWPRCSTCRSRSTASTAACRASRGADAATTTTRPTRRPGPRASPACRATQIVDRGAPVRRQRRQDARQVDGDHRRGDEPLVPRRHELPRRHQPADDVRLRRPERRRLGALRGPGEAAPADRLDGAGLRARLDPPAAADEQHQLLLRPHRPVALREARHGRDRLARSADKEAVRRQHDRLQRARRAHGLAAQRAAAEDQPAAGGEGRAPPPAWTRRTTRSGR